MITVPHPPSARPGLPPHAEAYLTSLRRPWTAIAEPTTCAIVEPRDAARFERAAALVLEAPSFSLIAAGPAATIERELQGLPHELAQDIARLAAHFATLSGSAKLRIRLDKITTNACRKIHADYTDLRLITTYAGPGTQIPLDNDPESETLVELPPGHIGLFKGRRYGTGHAPCFHRSPPAGDRAAVRLVLVIDTQTFTDRGEG